MNSSQQIQETNAQLRSFGTTVGGVFLFIAMWPFIRRGQNPRLWALILGGSLFVPGILTPSILRQPHRAWMQLAHVLGWINTKIILSLIYYVVFTPTAFIIRLTGKDPMNRFLLPNADSYRVVRQARSPSHMKRQF